VYRPGSALPSKMFFDEFSALLGMVATFELPVTITGDINIHFESTSNTDTSKFMEVLYAFGMNQFVSSSTHRLGGILDAVIAPIDSPLQNISVIDVSLSDHKLVHWTVPWKPSAIHYKTIERRSWKHFKIEDFISELQTSSICLSDVNPGDSKNVDDLVAQFNSTILTLLDKHAPKQKFKVRLRNHMPWFDEESRVLRRHVRQLERQYRRNGSDQNRDAWKAKLRESRKMSKTKAVDYWKNKLTSAGPDARRVWRCMDTLLGREKVNDDQTLSAQTYHDFMDDKIAQIRSTTASAPDPLFAHRCEPEISSFEQISEADVLSVIMESPNKQCDLDYLPTWLLKNCADSLAPFITRIVNKSLSSGVFPESWKHAKITPLIKKTGLDPSLPASYRPVSNLTFLSKVLERIVHKQLVQYLTVNNLFPHLQSAYRRSHSTETALLKVFTDIINSIDAGEVALLSFLDFSAAFDTVDHKILLQKLSSSFGFSSTVYDWISSYLTGRTQYVDCADQRTEPRHVVYGVPQGSVLGPLLFVLYTTEIGKIVEMNNLNHHSFADDSQIYSSCHPSKVPELKAQLLSCIREITDWTKSNRLQINPSKTEFIWCTTARRGKTFNREPFRLGDVTVEASTSVRNLGAYIDSDMSMTTHINHLVRTCFYNLRRIKHIRRFITTKTAILLVNSFVISRVDYCNSLLAGLPNCHLHRIQLVLNAAARLLYRGQKRDHITPLLRDKLHWLPIAARIQFKICLLTYKSLHGLAPQYITDFLKPVASVSRRSTLRSASNESLIIPATKTAFGARAFSVTGPTYWNQLPETVKNAATVNTFKRRLKTYLFELSYFS
jgi:hypothetical protein